MGGLRRPSAVEESHTASERRLPWLVLRGHVEDERAPGVADDAPGWVEGGRDQARAGLVTVEEAEHRVRGPGVELADPAAEAGARDEAAPALADERGVDEARGVVRRDADEDLLHDLVRQRRGRPRGHEAWPDSEPGWLELKAGVAVEWYERKILSVERIVSQ